eukprot:758439_1
MVTTIMVVIVLLLFRLSESLTFTTLFGNDNEQHGNIFEITTNENYLQINSFDINLDVSDPYDIYIWYKKCSYVGFENDISAWTPIHTQLAVASSGVDMATQLDLLETPLKLYPNTLYSFWIASPNIGAFDGIFGGGPIRYTNGIEECTLFSSDSNLKFYEGLGVRDVVGGSRFKTFSKRIWNGNIHYTIIDPFAPSNIDICTKPCSTFSPSNIPTEQPSNIPTEQPSNIPTEIPTTQSTQPTKAPSSDDSSYDNQNDDSHDDNSDDSDENELYDQ